MRKQTPKVLATKPSEFKVPPPRGAVQPSRSPSSIGSMVSYGQDQLSEYETPGTSAVVTPAEPFSKRGQVVQRPKTLGSLPSGRISRKAETKGKGKRTAEEDLVEADARLARALQEQEYDDSDSMPLAGKKRRAPLRVTEVSPSDDEQDGEAVSSDSGFETHQRTIQSTKRVKTNSGLSLPSRAAGAKARKSLAEQTLAGIVDSEDSALSDFIDSDSEMFNASEVADDDVDASTEASGPVASAIGGGDPLPARKRARRSRRLTWQERMMSRVSNRDLALAYFCTEYS